MEKLCVYHTHTYRGGSWEISNIKIRCLTDLEEFEENFIETWQSLFSYHRTTHSPPWRPIHDSFPNYLSLGILFFLIPFNFLWSTLISLISLIVFYLETFIASISSDTAYSLSASLISLENLEQNKRMLHVSKEEGELVLEKLKQCYSQSSDVLFSDFDAFKPQIWCFSWYFSFKLKPE